MNKQRFGFSLIEISFAMVILAIALLPIAGLITKDSKNSVIIANNIFAQQKARYILDTLLDQVAYEDLLIGSPGYLIGKSAKLGQFLFPKNSGSSDKQICEGKFENKGWVFNASLEVREIPASKISFSFFENPDVLGSWSNKGSLSQSLIKKSEQVEANGRPSYMQIHSSVYQHSDWGRKQVTFSYKDFYKSGNPVLMKALILRISWRSLSKAVAGDNKKLSVLWLVTHKAWLKAS
jgi:prepilin-type N-terminal cleavage/methylation domain-containing protein